MPMNQRSRLSDSELMKILEVLEQGMIPGRLRPEVTHVLRAVLGAPPDGNGVFGNVPQDLRKPDPDTGEDSVAKRVMARAETWLEDVSSVNGPSGFTLGCFPAGIEAGCRKHLECPSWIEKRCPFGEADSLVRDSVDLVKELEQRLKPAVAGKKNEDIMPVLRRCPFNGCVRPERSREWYSKLEEERMDEASLSERDPIEKLKAIIRALDSPRSPEKDRDAQKRRKVAEQNQAYSSKNSLDSLCPHFRRTWTERTDRPLGASWETAERRGLNVYRFLQCTLSRPWSFYGPDPDRPILQEGFNAWGLPMGLDSRPSGSDVTIPTTSGFAELPLRWMRTLGFSGAGVIVVDEEREAEGVYYLQMNSRMSFLRDYYEIPFFWFGEPLGRQWSEAVREEVGSSLRPQYLQCLFRAYRGATTGTAESNREFWIPEVQRVFNDGTSDRQAPFGRGRFLYCPDGEVSFFLLGLRLLLLLRALETEEKSQFEKSLFSEFVKIVSEEIELFPGRDFASSEGSDWDLARREAVEEKVRQVFENELMQLPRRSEVAKGGLLRELTTLGLRSEAGGATRRLRSLRAWLDHFDHALAGQGKDREEGRKAKGNVFIPEILLWKRESNGLEVPKQRREPTLFGQVVRRAEALLANPVKAATDLKNRSATGLLRELDEMQDSEGLEPDLYAVVASFLESLDQAVAMEEGEASGRIDKVIALLVRNARFPLAPYYAWRKSGNRDFRLGHFSVPIGQANAITSRDSDGVPWSENCFFLAGIDEDLLCGGTSLLYADDDSGVEDLRTALGRVALAGRVILAPLAESTINYTIFQNRLAAARQAEADAAESKAHQETTLMSPMVGRLKNPGLTEELLQKPRECLEFIRTFRPTVFALYEENSVYLEMSKNVLRKRRGDDGRVDYLAVDLRRYLEDFAERYLEWARQGELERKKKIVVTSPNWRVKIPRSYLRTVLWEVVTNHQKYSPKGAVIRLTAEEEGGGIRISVASPYGKAPERTGHGAGEAFVKRTLRFMMGMKSAEESREGFFRSEKSGSVFTTTMWLDLGRIASKWKGVYQRNR